MRLGQQQRIMGAVVGPVGRGTNKALLAGRAMLLVMGMLCTRR